jgi:hypothetical protein
MCKGEIMNPHLFYKNGDEIINLSHLVDADFEPEHESVDDLVTISSKLTLRFDAPHSTPYTSPDGDFLGVQHQPYTRIYRGEDAERMWENLNTYLQAVSEGVITY